MSVGLPVRRLERYELAKVAATYIAGVAVLAGVILGIVHFSTEKQISAGPALTVEQIRTLTPDQLKAILAPDQLRALQLPPGTVITIPTTPPKP